MTFQERLDKLEAEDRKVIEEFQEFLIYRKAYRDLKAKQLDESQKQIVAFALAEMLVKRPGWDVAIGEIVKKLGIESYFSTSEGITRLTKETDD